MLEVEVKYPVESLTHLRAVLTEQYGAVFRTVHETDVYYNAPDRDFARTDEALRLRYRVSDRGPETFLTYKGPKIDLATKTRREIDLPLAGTEERGPQFAELLEALGYRAVGEVRKIREKANCSWHQTTIEVSLDTLPQLQQRGGSGIFCELEILVPEEISQGETGGLDAAKEKLFAFAAAIGLPSPDRQCRRSYLGLILDDLPPCEAPHSR